VSDVRRPRWRFRYRDWTVEKMQSQWKPSRGLGIANLMVIHRLSDLDAVGGVRGNRF
jgi:hypothetical protein